MTHRKNSKLPPLSSLSNQHNSSLKTFTSPSTKDTESEHSSMKHFELPISQPKQKRNHCKHAHSSRSSWHLTLRKRKNTSSISSKYQRGKLTQRYHTPNKIRHFTTPAKKSPYLKQIEILSPIIYPVASSPEEPSNFGKSTPKMPPRRTLFHTSTPKILQEQHSIFKRTSKRNDTPKQKALKLLLDPEVINILIDKLDREKLLEDYMLLVEQLVTGSLPVTNIAVLSALQRAKLQSLKSTSGMKFHPRYKQFFEVAYKIIKGRGIRLLSGSKHRGQCIQHRVTHGKYPPKLGHINFAIPSLQVLSKSCVNLPKKIHPGIILSTFDLLNKEKQHVISVDGKTISQGLAGKQLGDINLWGYEGPPSLEQAQQHLDFLTTKVQYIADSIDSTLNTDIIAKLRSLLTDITFVIKEARHHRLKQQRKFNTYKVKCEKNPDLAKKYELAISNMKAYLIRSKNFLTRALVTNKTICGIISEVQLTPYNFSRSDNVDLTHQMNVYRLHDYNTVIKFYDVNRYPHLVKQHTPQWHFLRSQARITASSAHNALCLRTMKLHTEHFNHYVHKVPMKQPSPEVAKKMEYGTSNEISGLATLAAIFMPALLPPCCILYEEGSSFLGTPSFPTLMEISPDGYIKPTCNHPDMCGYCQSAIGHKAITVEIKCPYPHENEDVLPVHYHIPTYYAIQLLSQMKAKDTTSAIYVCYSKESSTFFLLDFDENIWDQMWKLVVELFGSTRPTKQTKVPQYKQPLLQKLESYINNNSRLLVEVPSCFGMQSGLNESMANGPYYIPPQKQFTLATAQSIANEIKVLCANTLGMLQEGFQLLRCKATEVLAFIISDIDRQFSPSLPPHMPIAYALKGSSLSIETLRELLTKVRVACQERSTKILCECFDGQWAMMVFKSQTGEPLTRIQLMKKLWNNVRKEKKSELLKIIESRCTITCVGHDFLQKCTLTSGQETVKDNIILQKTHNGSLVISTTDDMDKIYTSRSPQIWETPDMRAKRDKIKAKEQHVPKSSAGLSTPEIQMMQQVFASLHHDNPLSIYCQILTSLQQLKGSHKWMYVSPADMKMYHLSSSITISRLLVKELDSIASVVKHFTGRSVYDKAKLNKNQKVNIINRLFGNGIDLKYKPMRKQQEPSRYKSPVKLKVLAKRHILESLYPKAALAAAVCSLKFEGYENTWESRSTVPLHIYLPFLNDTHTMYWYPEYSKAIEQHLMRTLDPTHLLTNLRTVFTQKGALGLSPMDYQYVWQAGIIPQVILQDNLDQQNTMVAKNCFSLKVEDCLLKNERFEAARVVKIVREWYEACDERGLLAAQRVKQLHEISKLLLENMNFGHFPPPGSNVQGVPLVTVGEYELWAFSTTW